MDSKRQAAQPRTLQGLPNKKFGPTQYQLIALYVGCPHWRWMFWLVEVIQGTVYCNHLGLVMRMVCSLLFARGKREATTRGVLSPGVTMRKQIQTQKPTFENAETMASDGSPCKA